MSRRYCEECGGVIGSGILCKKCRDDPEVMRRRMASAAKDRKQSTLF